MPSGDWHVYPQRDLIEHEVDGEDCPCVPTLEPVEREDGSFGWVHRHHSLDGREQRERGHARNRTTGAAEAQQTPGGAEKSQEVTTTDDR